MEWIYHIATEKAPETAPVKHYRPEGGEGPETYAQVKNVPGKGLEITLLCFEEEPLARYTKPNEPVHTDSCVEAFINCFPDMEGKGYFNLEMNFNGASHCSFGTCRYDRVYLIDKGLPHPTVHISTGEKDGKKYWQAQCLMEKSTLEALYGMECNFAPGHVMKGNFYKCAEDVAVPNWGSWAPVSALDFHAPHDFGTLIVTE